MKKAIFLDKDGTLVENVPYNVNPEKMRLLPTVGEGLRLLSSLGYQLIVISNQSGIARGYFKENDLTPMYKNLEKLVSQYNVFFDDFYYCPHHPDGVVNTYKKNCAFRKPSPGLFLKARDEHDLDLSQSFVIGDILDDCEAGRRAGCKTVLINNGNETEWILTDKRKPHVITDTFLEAAKSIANQTITENIVPKKEIFNYE